MEKTLCLYLFMLPTTWIKSLWCQRKKKQCNIVKDDGASWFFSFIFSLSKFYRIEFFFWEKNARKWNIQSIQQIEKKKDSEMETTNWYFEIRIFFISCLKSKVWILKHMIHLRFLVCLLRKNWKKMISFFWNIDLSEGTQKKNTN